MNWREIPGFSGYEASDTGEIRSHRCGGRFGADLRRAAPKPMTKIVSHDGYYRVSVRNDAGKQRMVYVHHLMLLAFAGPRPDGCEASHKNGVRTLNTPGNLAWETKAQNNSRKKEHGTQPRYVGERNPAARVSDTQRALIRARYAAGGVSQRALASEFGLAQSSIGDIVKASDVAVALTVAQRVPS